MRYVYFRWLCAAVFIGLVWPSNAFSLIRIGVRGGVTVDPDQINIGLVSSIPIGVSGVLLQPNIDFGYGDNLTIVSLNLDTVYRIPTGTDAFKAYAGGGPGISIVHGSVGSFTRASAGASLVFGGAVRPGGFRPLSLEMRVGLGNFQGLKLLCGITF